METSTDNEQEVLCEKIINEINAVFVKDNDFEEIVPAVKTLYELRSSFEIIPTILNCNKSPVIHVDHNLGLESWCAKHVYEHAHHTLLACRRRQQQQPHTAFQQQHNQQQHQQQQYRYLQQSDALLKYLNVALLINPDVTSFWHIRRQLVQKNRLRINREFQFSALILSKKPKSSEAFAYRRWLFSFQNDFSLHGNRNLAGSESIDWPYEIGICERCADRSSSNYHAWAHRQWVLQNAPYLIKSELMLSEKFMRKHISDYSSYHYRQLAITRAYELRFYDADELSQLANLKSLIGYYLVGNVCSAEEIMQTLLPDVDRVAVGEQRLKSFLYCCNLAAHDMRLCDDQKNMYGEHESFELHRCASLKFIVENCVRLLLGGELLGISGQPPPTPAQLQLLNARLRRFDYGSHEFLAAVKRSESLLGERHRHWCTVFLGFDYSEEASGIHMEPVVL